MSIQLSKSSLLRLGGAVAAAVVVTVGSIALTAGSPRRHGAAVAVKTSARAEIGDPNDAALGGERYLMSCAVCHGPEGQGMPHQGANLKTSRFVAERSDAELLAFLQVGRRADEPSSAMKLPMPPRGAAPLTDLQLRQIIAHLRQVQRSGGPGATASALP